MVGLCLAQLQGAVAPSLQRDISSPTIQRNKRNRTNMSFAYDLTTTAAPKRMGRCLNDTSPSTTDELPSANEVFLRLGVHVRKALGPRTRPVAQQEDIHPARAVVRVDEVVVPVRRPRARGGRLLRVVVRDFGCRRRVREVNHGGAAHIRR